MADTSLWKSFQQCQEYRHAAAWQKPLLDPSRFFRNQLRKRGGLRLPPGTVRLVDAFHFAGFSVVHGEGVSDEIASYGVFEDSLTEAFLHLVKPGQVVFDIGMHLGYFTTLFARLVEARGYVHAFEPTPSTREIAAANTRAFPHVTVHPVAMWSSAGTLKFRDFGLQWMAFNSFTSPKMKEGPPPPREYEVNTMTLDQFRGSIAKPVALLKIDAESAEMEILKGGQKMLEQDQPVVTLEVGEDQPGRPSSRSLVEWMSCHGFAVWEYRDGKFCRHQPKDTYAYDNLIFAPRQRDLSLEAR